MVNLYSFIQRKDSKLAHEWVESTKTLVNSDPFDLANDLVTPSYKCYNNNIDVCLMVGNQILLF